MYCFSSDQVWIVWMHGYFITLIEKEEKKKLPHEIRAFLSKVIPM